MVCHCLLHGFYNCVPIFDNRALVVYNPLMLFCCLSFIISLYNPPLGFYNASLGFYPPLMGFYGYLLQNFHHRGFRIGNEGSCRPSVNTVVIPVVPIWTIWYGRALRQA